MISPGGTIYAIAAEGTPLVKIGSTRTSVQKRLKALQTGQPFPLHILAALPVQTNLTTIERQIHAFLAQDKRQGEWFETPIDTAILEALILRAVLFIDTQRRHKQEQVAMATAKKEATRLRRSRYPVAEFCGNRIRTVREQQGISLRALAQRMKVSHQVLSKVELGTVHTTVGMLTDIADLLGVSPGSLFPRRPPRARKDTEALTLLTNGTRSSHG